MNRETAYSVVYLHDLLSGEAVAEPDAVRAARYTGPLVNLYTLLQAQGLEAAQRSWETMSRIEPALATALTLHGDARLDLVELPELGGLPVPTYLVEDMLVTGGFTVMYGPSGSAKTFLALELAAQVAKTQCVVYYAGEGKSGYVSRIDALCLQHKIDNKSLHLNLAFSPMDLCDPYHVWEHIEQLRQQPPALIVIDTLASAMVGADENSARSMGMVVKNIDEIRRELGSSILLIHDTGRDTRGARGSSVLRGGSDIMVSVKKKDEQITVTRSKSKNDAPFEPKYYTLQEVLLPGERASCVVVVSAKSDTYVSQRADRTRRILERLDRAPAGAKQISVYTGIAEPTVYKEVFLLKADGFVRHEKKGAPYFITEAGREVLLKMEGDLFDEAA